MGNKLDLKPKADLVLSPRDKYQCLPGIMYRRLQIIVKLNSNNIPFKITLNMKLSTPGLDFKMTTLIVLLKSGVQVVQAIFLVVP